MSSIIDMQAFTAFERSSALSQPTLSTIALRKRYVSGESQSLFPETPKSTSVSVNVCGIAIVDDKDCIEVDLEDTEVADIPKPSLFSSLCSRVLNFFKDLFKRTIA